MSKRIKVKEIAQQLAIGEKKVCAMLRDGQIPSIRVGGRWIISRAAFERWFDNCGLATPPAERPAERIFLQ